MVAQPVINSISGTTSRCAKTGTLTANATGGSGTLLYSLISPSVETRPNQTSNVFAALAPGKYYVRVVDVNSAVDTAVYTVTGSYKVPSYSYSLKSPSCSKANGNFSINKTSGGRAPLQYKIVSGPSTTGWQNSNSFNGMPSGSYTVAIIDSCGNTKNISVTLTDTTFSPLSIYRTSSRAMPSSCDSFTMYFYALRGLGPLKYRIINGTDTFKFSSNQNVDLKKGVTYKYEVVDQCGNARSYSITENKFLNVTFLFRCNGYEIRINPYYYGALYSSTCFKYGVVNKSTNAAVWQTDRTFTVDSGVAYTCYAIDTCCNDTFKVDQTFTRTSNLYANKSYVSNLDSTIGVIVYNYSTRYPYHLVLLKTPFSNTDSFTTTKDQYVQAKLPYKFGDGDTIGFYNVQYAILNNMPKGKYTFLVVDTCGLSDTLEVEVLETDLWKRNIRHKVLTGCPSGHRIAYSIDNNKGYQPTFYFKQLSPSTSTANFTSKIKNPVLYDTINSLNAGTYLFELVNPWGGVFFTGSGAGYIRDTVVVKDPGYPKLNFPVTYSCNDGSSSIINTVENGLKPFEYRIKSTDSTTWSAYQSSPEFHNLKAGTYDIEVKDSCGNTNRTASSSGSQTAPALKLNFKCIKDSLELFGNDIYGVKYRWYKGNTVISNNRVHSFKPYGSTNYGDYRLQVYINTTNGVCVDTFASIKLSANIELEGPYLWACDSIYYNKKWIKKNGIYSDTATSVGGCDSVTTHKIVIGETTLTSIDTATCDSIYFLNQWITKDSTVYDTIKGKGFIRDTIVNAERVDCDSIIKYNIKVKESSYTYKNETHCDSALINGNWYSTSQLVKDTFTNSLDCDSFVHTTLTINKTVRTNQNITYCDSGMVQGNWYNTTQTINDTFTTYLNCDSIVITDLTVNYTQLTNVNVTNCDSSLVNGNWYFSTQEVRDTFVTYLNCDSVVVTDLIVNYTKVTPVNTTVCDSGLVHGIMYYNTQLIKDSFTSYLNCDSVVHTNLTVNPVMRTYEWQTNCDSGQVQGAWYSNSQVVYDTFNSYLNCDSIIITDLTVNYTQVTPVDATNCDSAIVQGNWYFRTQEVRDTFTSYLNCDSVVVTNLVINPTMITITNASVCDSMNINGNWYFTSQTVIDSFLTSERCDSIVYTDLIVRSSFIQRHTDTFCTYYEYELDDGRIVSEQGIYQSVYSNVENCDSIIEMNLIEKDCSPCTILFPNAFTPNVDGVNEGFKREGTCTFKTFQLSIYNRWGELLFYTEDPEGIWDGTFEGVVVPQGVYFYSCFYVNNEKKVTNIHGDITVLK